MTFYYLFIFRHDVTDKGGKMRFNYLVLILSTSRNLRCIYCGIISSFQDNLCLLTWVLIEPLSWVFQWYQLLWPTPLLFVIDFRSRTLSKVILWLFTHNLTLIQNSSSLKTDLRKWQNNSNTKTDMDRLPKILRDLVTYISDEVFNVFNYSARDQKKMWHHIYLLIYSRI